MDVIAAQALLFFTAGFETSSTTMTFCLYELAQNPDIQERVQAEIDSVSEQHGGKITYDSILQMQYLDKVVNGELKGRISASGCQFESRPLEQNLCIVFNAQHSAT
jgi:cytochrome P450 family 6